MKPMASRTTTKPQTRAVNLRIREDVRDLIDRAASSQSKTRSEFMIDAARKAAEDLLIDQMLIRVDQSTFAQFKELLDRPPTNKGYDRLMAAPLPWQK